MVEADKDLYLYLTRGPESVGYFKSSLITAALHADSSNLELLSRGYPDLVKAVIAYHSSVDYWNKIKQEMEKCAS